ncbi:hypothetical protein POKO110462_18155 [Pontibacter korlensis]|uniref:Uncharacterized protein n=1 Tax=Pontibacter korlensis TaxID=400092 RepID=A0A0E3UW18_9BACT|nr:hypothetical protein [Pontibacter korlensis]AKD02316.1 hypothetical protein PKOR_03185 [Pontibacter korlensis]
MTSLTNQIQQDKKEALLKYYFGSKETLYCAIFATRLKQFSDEVRKFENLDLNPYQKLEAYLNTFISQIAANKDIHRLLCNQLA